MGLVQNFIILRAADGRNINYAVGGEVSTLCETSGGNQGAVVLLLLAPIHVSLGTFCSNHPLAAHKTLVP